MFHQIWEFGDIIFSKIFSVSISPLPLEFNDTDIKVQLLFYGLCAFYFILRKHLLSLFLRLDIFLLKFMDSWYPLHNLSWTIFFHICGHVHARNFYSQITCIIYALSLYSLVCLSIRVELKIWVEEVGGHREELPKACSAPVALTLTRASSPSQEASLPPDQEEMCYTWWL